MQDKKCIVEQIRALNSKLNMPAVLDYYGIEYEAHGERFKVICPFHDDTNPSLQVFTDNESGQDSWWCPVCNENGDCFRFLQMQTGSFKEAVDVAKEISKGVEGGGVSPQYQEAMRRQKLRKKVYLLDYKLGIKYRDWLISLEEHPQYEEACKKVDAVFERLDGLVEEGRLEDAIRFIRERDRRLRRVRSNNE